MKKGKALVLFSGGQDSTTCLGWALERFEQVGAIGFNYGQRHTVELEQARVIAERHGVLLKVVKVPFFGSLVDSALTKETGSVNKPHSRIKDLPASFVPNRNAFFLTLAHAYAQRVGAEVVVTGTCQTDYSGYPDCRRVFIDAIEKALNLGSNQAIKILTPLMELTKAQTFALAKECGVLYDVVELSHTCYNGDHKTENPWGYGCGECPACKLRAKGWREYLLLEEE